MTTLYENFLSGIIMDDPLLNNVTIINSMGFASIPVITAPNKMWLTLDPIGVDGAPEIAQIIDHVALTTKVTVLRAQQSTIAREHVMGTNWAVSFTKTDIDDIYNASGTKGTGAPVGTGTNGDWYYDLTNKRAYRSDGIGWVIMSEPLQTGFTPTVIANAGTITTVSATFQYSRNDGWLRWSAIISITTNGTGAGSINMSLPVAISASVAAIGTGREGNINGHMLNVVNGGGANCTIFKYDNTYAGASGASLGIGGQYLMTTRYS